MRTRHHISMAVALAAGLSAVCVFSRPNAEKFGAIAQETRATAADGPNRLFSPYVDKNGEISLPMAYQRNWAHLGGWAVATKEGEAQHEMHNVYTQPETVVAYNRSGEFPDGAVLVKEVRGVQADQLTAGHAAWATDIKIWFVMIKDRKERFVDNDHWGDGWGWALFEAKNPTKNVSVGYDTSCLACHVPAEETDWVYVHGYPGLNQPTK